MGSRRCFFSWIVLMVTLGRAEPWRSGNEVMLMLPPVQFRNQRGYRLLPLLDAKSGEKSNLALISDSCFRSHQIHLDSNFTVSLFWRRNSSLKPLIRNK